MSKSSDLTNKLNNDILIGASQRMPNLFLYRNNRINATAENSDGSYRYIRAGINGQGDISGCMGPMGRRVELETKRGKDKLRQSQIDFRAKILALGGIYLECRNAEDTLADLEILYRGEGN